MKSAVQDANMAQKLWGTRRVGLGEAEAFLLNTSCVPPVVCLRHSNWAMQLTSVKH